MTNGILIGLSALAGVWLGWFAVPICLSVLGIIILVDQQRKWSLILACLAFSSLGAWRSTSIEPSVTSDLLSISTGAIGQVESFPRASGDGHRVILQVSELCIADQCTPADETVLVYLKEQESPIARGQTIRVEWDVQPLLELPPGYRGFVQSEGASAQARASNVQVMEEGPGVFALLSRVNQRISGSLSTHLPGDAGALASGIVIGDDSSLSDVASENFRATGTTHITAVSGQNVTVILAFLTIWWQPRRAGARLVFHALLLMVIWFYALLVGLEPPALRAAVMASLVILSSHAGRRPDPMTSLVITLGAMALWQPLVVHGVGFWLSATASAALCLALPKQLQLDSKRWWLKLASGPIFASLATMPIALATFGTWSPIGILANILLAPVINLAFLVTYPFTLIALVFPWLASALAFIPGIVLDWAIVIVDWLAPIASEVRVTTLSPASMLMLWLPIAGVVWIISHESDRWIRRATRRIST